MDKFKAKEVMELTGVPKSRLGPWVAAGAIVPLKEDFRRGGVNIYSRQNLAEVLICEKLSDHSLPVREMVRTVKNMQNTCGERIVGIEKGMEDKPAVEWWTDKCRIEHVVVENAWQKLKKNPEMCLCLTQIKNVRNLLGGGEAEPVPPFTLEDVWPGINRSGRNTTYYPDVIKIEEIAKKLKDYSSLILIDLKPIMKKAGMIKE